MIFLTYARPQPLRRKDVYRDIFYYGSLDSLIVSCSFTGIFDLKVGRSPLLYPHR